MRLNELLREVQETRPEKLRVVDFGAYLSERSGGAFDRALRPDGVHYSPSGGKALLSKWLGARTLEHLAKPGSDKRVMR